MHILKYFVFPLLFLAFYCLNYSVFSVALQDDVEFQKGKKRVKNRKKQKEFWKRFLFLDIRKEVVRWHYLLFWVNLGAFVTAFAAVFVSFAYESTIATRVFLAACSVMFLTLGVACHIRWPLYAGNVVRNRKKYKEKNR